MTESSKYLELLVPAVPIVVFVAFWWGHDISTGTIPSLYFEMARAIESANYALPRRVPHFTTGGLPFAYPPLAFYVLAIVHDLTGLRFFTVGKWLSLVYGVATSA